MDYEVVVVGGGIGGLTTAALLARRGVKVCLFERQSHVGGCVANFECLGSEFEPTYGLYRGFGPGEIFDRVFKELRINVPRTRKLSPAYTVRLPNGIEIPISQALGEFEDALSSAFPECPDTAVRFYRRIMATSETNAAHPTASYLADCSSRFRAFIDGQLKMFLQSSIESCSLTEAASVLNPQQDFSSIQGGAQIVADSLADSIRQAGGVLRLDTPVLKIAYASDGNPIGADLLTGERVIATKAIVSNLTLWDTYGKLIGLSHAPGGIASRLRTLRSPGAYLLFLSIEEGAAQRLSSPRILVLTDVKERDENNQWENGFFFSCGASTRAPNGKLPITVTTLTNAEDWFSFHEDQSTHELQDQKMLETVWVKLHSTMPELGDAVEVIETANPQTYYETTRRKFGMIGRPQFRKGEDYGTLTTPFRNVFVTSDTTSDGFGIASVAEAGLRLANMLTQH